MSTEERLSPRRRGMAMMLVLVLSVVILGMGLAMLGLTGDVLSTSADTRAKVRARYAAESAISVAIADAVYQAGNIFGGSVSASTRDVSLGNDQGTADVSSGNNLGQEVILQKRSPMNYLRGNKIPLKIDATGKAGSAKSRISASVALYQVPIYQFGVFYEGPLEISPGPDMSVMGRVHTNDTAYFRGAATLQFQGPVTVAGEIFQWVRAPGTSHLKYRRKPDSTTNLYEPPGLTTNLVAMTAATQPPEIGGVSNVRFRETKLILPIGVGTPHSILGVCDGTNDPQALKRQKFDCIVQNPARASSEARFVVTTATPTLPSWITGPRVFYDRREKKWVKFWDFNVQALAASANRDSIFYLDDLVRARAKITGAGPTDSVINAFRIRNADVLPRNMTIASGKPIYIMGDFNKWDASGNVNNYKNAQIASDAVTVLSANWLDWDSAHLGGSLSYTASSLEQKFANSNWRTCALCGGTNSLTTGYTGGTISNSTIQINAAMITGNKPSSAPCRQKRTEGEFDACYEGGWHNTLRFLENWGTTRTVTFKGSFVCMWAAQAPGLTTDPSIRMIGGGYYNPPVRVWGYDTRFDDLNNMPPGSPFLATAILTNWLERN
ncbi:MAG: hypothetical protein RL173_2063 [Fibrobacterota bacterium]|jgi:hypothetical protein